LREIIWRERVESSAKDLSPICFLKYFQHHPLIEMVMAEAEGEGGATPILQVLRVLTLSPICFLKYLRFFF